MNKNQLTQVGEALYGAKWMGRLAIDLGMSPPSVSNIVNKDLPVRPAVIEKLWQLVEARLVALSAARDMLANERFMNPMNDRHRRTVEHWLKSRGAMAQSVAVAAPSPQPVLHDDFGPEIVHSPFGGFNCAQHPSVGQEMAIRSLQDWRDAFAAMSAAELLAQDEDAMTADIHGAYEGEKDRREERGEIGYDESEQKYFVVAAKKRLD